MMNVDDTLLMAYVDGELSPEQRATNARKQTRHYSG